MKTKRKFVVVSLSLVLTLLMATAAFAATNVNPAEIIADLTGKTQSEIITERGQGETFGQVAQKNGVTELFREKMLEHKKTILKQRVNEGNITQEQAEIIQKNIEDRMANCDGTFNGQREKIGCGFKKGLGYGNSQGQGRGMGFGRNTNK